MSAPNGLLYLWGLLRLAALGLLSIVLIDGAFDSSGFDPWDRRPDLPEGVFTLLKILVSGVAVWAVWDIVRILKRVPSGSSHFVLWLVVALVHQPIFPLHFEYHTWLWIDLFTLIFMLFEFILSWAVGRSIVNERVP
jgi:hypothetical protein